MNGKTVIYIAGYGRSGSTLLERILSSHEKIASAGALSNFLNYIDSESSVCSCGEPIEECEFWTDAREHAGGDL